MIIDSFMFFNEVELLELRLNELNSVCDWFVIVESAQTFSGKNKSYTFQEHRERFSAFLHKIIYFQVPKLPPLIDDKEKNRFKLEKFNRDKLFDAITHVPGVNLNDIILLSDADEIPSEDGVRRLAQKIKEAEIFSFKQDHYRVTLAGRVSDEWDPWPGTVAFKYGLFSEYTPDEIRSEARIDRFYKESQNRTLKLEVIENGGWHFSYFGGSKAIEWKTASFSHGAKDSAVHYNQNAQEYVSVTDEMMLSKETILACESTLEQVQGTLPRYLLENSEKFANFIIGDIA